MASRLEAVTFEVADAPAVAAFWAGLLEREVLAESDGALVPGNERQVGLRFLTSDTDQVGPRRLHLHLTSPKMEGDWAGDSSRRSRESLAYHAAGLRVTR